MYRSRSSSVGVLPGYRVGGYRRTQEQAAGLAGSTLSSVLSTAGSIAGNFAGGSRRDEFDEGDSDSEKSLSDGVIGTAIAGVTLAVGLFMGRMGPKQKVYTTKIVNDAEPLLQQNLAAYQASNHYASEQAQALANYDQIWSAVVASCDRPELGNPGQACIRDRERGGRWPWVVYYRDPIANDPDVRPDPSPVDMVASVLGGIGSLGSLVPLLLGGAVLYLVLDE